ncbi:hypothetical protein E2C01_060703 [Portunus trituberculatus]|uniref:Uncharacterized protein n=1 Tax=Portunus trituberculatus TaxID=210409 RepID=A0A5B7HCV5_PORTR|nr:hypothetical protein [Portunus trituberculatus]
MYHHSHLQYRRSTPAPVSAITRKHYLITPHHLHYTTQTATIPSSPPLHHTTLSSSYHCTLVTTSIPHCTPGEGSSQYRTPTRHQHKPDRQVFPQPASLHSPEPAARPAPASSQPPPPPLLKSRYWLSLPPCSLFASLRAVAAAYCVGLGRGVLPALCQPPKEPLSPSFPASLPPLQSHFPPIRSPTAHTGLSSTIPAVPSSALASTSTPLTSPSCKTCDNPHIKTHTTRRTHSRTHTYARTPPSSCLSGALSPKHTQLNNN